MRDPRDVPVNWTNRKVSRLFYAFPPSRHDSVDRDKSRPRFRVEECPGSSPGASDRRYHLRQYHRRNCVYACLRLHARYLVIDLRGGASLPHPLIFASFGDGDRPRCCCIPSFSPPSLSLFIYLSLACDPAKN